MTFAYLKCDYFPGMFSDEYSVSFRGCEYPKSDLGSVFVSKEQVTQKGKNSGLVRILIEKTGKETSNIRVVWAKEDSTKFFTVPNEDIIFEN